MRLIFAVADEKYEYVRIEKDKWPALKPSVGAPNGQLPILEIDGKIFGQSLACARYLARKFKIAGKTDLEQLQADMLIDCLEDGTKPLHALFFEKDETRKAEFKKKYSEEQLIPTYASLENILKSNKGGDGFLVGDALTWADLYFFVFASWGKASGNEAVLDKYPKLKALEKRVESVPKVAGWIAKRPVTEM